MATNQFSKVVTQVQQTPQTQKAGTLIEGIAQQMQQSDNQQLQQWGQELQQAKSQLVSALQQS